MSRIFSFFIFLILATSCSNQPVAESSNSSCNSGDCIKNLNKLASPETQAKTPKGKAPLKKSN